MKPITKIMVFLVSAFIIVIIITFIAKPKTGGDAIINQNATTTVSSRYITYLISDVAKHATSTDCWTAVGGNVFDVTPFVQKHPGGVPNISKVCGIDATAIFTKQHGTNQNAQKALESFKIGILTE